MSHHRQSRLSVSVVAPRRAERAARAVMPRGRRGASRGWLVAATLVATVHVLCPRWLTAVERTGQARSITQWSHRMWQDELPQTTVHTIEQSRDGYLWLGTYDGLVRFDGVRLAPLDPATRAEIPGSSVLVVHEDRRGRLWVGTNSGLAVLDRSGRESAVDASSVGNVAVLSLSELADGSLWVGTSAGLLHFDGRSFAPVPGLAATPVRAVSADGAGRLWACTDAGLRAVDGDPTVVQPFGALGEAPCRALLLAQDESLWLGSSAGLARDAGDELTVFTTADGLPSHDVRALLEDREGAIWVGTQDAGVVRVADGRVSVYSSRQGLSHNLVRSLFQDREGSVWIGTNAGLDQLREAKVVAHTSREGLTNDFVRAVFEDRDGVVWIGTDGGGLNRYADGELSAVTVADGLPSPSVRTIDQAPDGALWLGTRAGVCRMENGRFTTLTRRDGLSSDLIRVVYFDREGTLWIGTEGGGLDRWDDGVVSSLSRRDGLAGDDVRALYEDRGGRLWVATDHGVSCLAAGAAPLTYRRGDGLADDNVFTFFEDGERGLWIGSERGLTLFRDGRLEAVDPAAGLADAHVFWLLADLDGDFWASSNLGVYRLDADSLYDVVDGRAGRIVAERFDTSHGMPTDHCNGVSQPAGWRTRAGVVWFATTRGVVEIDPAHLVRNDIAPTVAIESLRVDGGTQALGPELGVAPGHHHVELHYTALSFAAPERVFFRYRLDGFDRAWVDAGVRRVAYYTRLPAGSYTFRVTACNNDGVWNEWGATQALVVRPAPWERWWAWVVYLAVAGGLVLAAHRLRVRRLTRSNLALEAKVAERTAELDERNRALAAKVRELEISERQALAAEKRAIEASRAKSVFLSAMSHELRTPLNAIIGFSGILIERLGGTLDAKHAGFLGNIRAAGQHLLGLINDLLDLAKIEAGRLTLAVEECDLHALVEGACRLIHGMSHGRGITTELQLPPDLPRLHADPMRVKQVLFNLLSNAVKFSPDGAAVVVRAERLAADQSPLGVESLRVDVVDRGIGIPREHHERVFDEFHQVDSGASRRFQGTGLGLALVKRLLEQQGGTVSLVSEPGVGSTFSVTLPVATPPSAAAGEPPALVGDAAEPVRPGRDGLHRR